ncbi:MAG: T9SS type A sorting domain-containing protein, partial [Ferruginibacter sp.]
TNALKAVTFNYNIDGGQNLIFNWTGNLAKCSAPLTISLPTLNVPAGNHLFTVFTSKPNGVDDTVPLNDTARSSFAVIAIVNGSVSEDFEENAFPPANWAVQNFDNNTTWARTTAAARTGAASMVINNFTYSLANTLDKFVSPRVVFGTVDSALVSFDYSYNLGAQFPGNSGLPVDTLEVALTTDCGITTTTIWKKWGADLQTQNNPNYPTNIAYIPTLTTQWRNERINITPMIQGVPDFQVYFIAKGNKQNNLYIDNINIIGKVLPERLKNQGYLIYPSPFSSSFRIHHLIPPIDLRSAQVYNAAGQLVWDKRFDGNSPTEVNVDLRNLARGVYILKMIYSDKIIVERMVKN